MLTHSRPSLAQSLRKDAASAHVPFRLPYGGGSGDGHGMTRSPSTPDGSGMNDRPAISASTFETRATSWEMLARGTDNYLIGRVAEGNRARSSVRVCGDMSYSSVSGHLRVSE